VRGRPVVKLFSPRAGSGGRHSLAANYTQALSSIIISTLNGLRHHSPVTSYPSVGSDDLKEMLFRLARAFSIPNLEYTECPRRDLGVTFAHVAPGSIEHA